MTEIQDNDHEIFVCVQQTLDNHKLRIWDVNSNLIKAEFGESQTFSCVKIGKTQKDKIIALGTDNGDIYLYSLNSGKIFNKLSGDHRSKVTDFEFGSDSTAYSCANDGTIITWDLSSFKQQRSWKSAITSVNKIKLQPAGNFLVVAGHTVEIWDINTNVCVKNITGHASLINQIVFSNDSKHFFTIADQERFINIWSCGSNDGDFELSTTALSVESNVIKINIDSVSGNVIAVTEDGKISVWSDPISFHKSKQSSKKRKHRSKVADGVIQFLKEGKEDILLVLNAWFAFNTKKIVVMRGTPVLPEFETIGYLINDEVNIIKNNTFHRSESKPLSKKSSAKRAKYSEQNATIMGQVNFAVTQPTEELVESEDIVAEMPIGSTLEEKLKALQVLDSSKPLSNSQKKNLPPKADSLQQMLTQALHSNDNQLLEECLDVADFRIINNTIQRLPTRYVLPMLSQIVSRFQSKPSRGLILSRWIKAVLLIHMAYLMTQPNLVNQLGPLYQTIDSRLGVFNKLMRLQGRLDIIDQQVRIRNMSNSDEAIIMEEPLMVYDENETHVYESEDEIEEGSIIDAEEMDEDEMDSEEEECEDTFEE